MLRIVAVDHPELPPFSMPDRFSREIVFFMSTPGRNNAPTLPEKEYWIDPPSARRWLEELVIQIVSPLDAASKAEIELTDEQEAWLQWLVDHDIHHVRVES